IGILAHSFPPSITRTIAFAVFSAGNPVGGGLAFICGAVVTEFSAAGWRAVFYLNAGLSALTFIGAWFVVDADVPSTEADPRVDWVGAAIVSSGLILLLFALGQGPIAPNGFATGYIIACLIIGVLLVIAFVAWEYYLEKYSTRPPLMHLEIWTRANGKFAAMAAIAFWESCSFFAWMLWTQLYYQDFLGLSPVQAMLRFLPMVITGLMLNVLVGLIANIVDVAWLCVFGSAATGVACLLLAIINPNVTYWAYGFPAFILSVWGADFIFACGTLFFALIAKPHEQSVAGGIFQTVSQLAGAFGLAISTIVHNEILKNKKAGLGLPQDTDVSLLPQDLVLTSYKSAQWSNFAFAMLAMVISAVFLRGVGVVGHRKPKEANLEASTVEDETDTGILDVNKEKDDN
ncbi:hypothetical protein M422DRAFT_27007, partial [Sphaerobolus stellatus SS14]